jgi:NAD+ synthase
LDKQAVADHIVSWLKGYCEQAGTKGFVVGISGGVDSALTSTLCALTGKNVLLLNMPIRQTTAEYARSCAHIDNMKSRFANISGAEINLTSTFSEFEEQMPFDPQTQHLTMANARARLRMTTLYALGQANGLLVAGTGNKIEDFGIGFFTKYGDGGVDLSPIADLTKSDVWQLAAHLGVIEEIVMAKPTDGLWEDGRSDEDQIGASYPELEWAMDFKGDASELSQRQQEVLGIYRRLHAANRHKMLPIPVCLIPENLKKA